VEEAERGRIDPEFDAVAGLDTRGGIQAAEQQDAPTNRLRLEVGDRGHADVRGNLENLAVTTGSASISAWASSSDPRISLDLATACSRA
jgi:hypothetical protein